MALILVLVLVFVAIKLFGGLLRAAVMLIALFIVAAIGLRTYHFLVDELRSASLATHRLSAFAAHHRLDVAGVLVATAIVTVGLLWLFARRKRRATPSVDDRLLAAATRLRADRRPINAGSLAETARVDRRDAIDWMTEHPASAMPAFQ